MEVSPPKSVQGTVPVVQTITLPPGRTQYRLVAPRMNVSAIYAWADRQIFETNEFTMVGLYASKFEVCLKKISSSGQILPVNAWFGGSADHAKLSPEMRLVIEFEKEINHPVTIAFCGGNILSTSDGFTTFRFTDSPPYLSAIQ